MLRCYCTVCSATRPYGPDIGLQYGLRYTSHNTVTFSGFIRYAVPEFISKGGYGDFFMSAKEPATYTT